MSTRASLSRALLRRMLLGYGAMATLLLAALGVYEHRRLHRMFEETVQALAGTFSPAAASALWDYQTPVLEALVGGIGAHPVVVHVEVLDPEGRHLASWSHPDRLPASERLIVRRPLERLGPSGGRRRLGTLVIASSEALVEARLVPTLTRGGAIALALLLVVMGGMWRLVQIHVVRRLEDLDGRTRQLDPAQMPEEGSLVLEGPPDEIGHLAETLESLRQRVRSHLEERRASEIYISELNQDLCRAITHAESANQAKVAFLRRMSHEFMTPLNHVRLHAELLKGEVAPSLQLDVRRIQLAATELAERVRDILDLVALESGGLAPQPAVLEAAALSMELTTLALPWAEAGGNRLWVSFEGIPHGVEADGAMLLRVLAKLVHNACRFTSEGEVEVVGSATAEGLRFEVRDTGRGMGPDVLEGVFRLFHQGDEGLTRAYGGMGLGLPISQRLVAAMGGRISVESREGQGSCFRIDLPAGGRPPLSWPDSVGADHGG